MSRCWAPSWRLRSRRWRSLWPASMIRAREPAELLEPRPQLDVQPGVLERDAERGGDRAEQLGLVLE